MRKVKTGFFGINQRTFLLHVLAQDLTQRGVQQVDAASAAIVDGIMRRLHASGSVDLRPDRLEVEAALERIAHRLLAQREWDRDDMRIPSAPG